MKKFIIAIDSSSDIPYDELKKEGVEEIFFKCSGSDNSISTIVDPKIFFNNMKNGIIYKTSQINPLEYHDFFKKIYEKYKLPIIYICLGSGLSNTINSAFMAIKMLEDENDKIDIRPLDSKLASLGLKLLLDVALDLQNKEYDIDQTMEILKEKVNNINTYYTTNTLTYFVRGGRLSKVKGFIGNALKINPILDCDPKGSLRVIENNRGTYKTFKSIVNKVKENAIDPKEQTLYICHSLRLDEAIELANLINNEVHFKNIKYYEFGPIIGSHTGPNLIAVFYFGKPRLNEVCQSINKDELINELDKILAK